MIRPLRWKLTAILGGAMLVVACSAVAGAQSPLPDPQSASQVTAGQQKQLEQLKQLEQQLQKDRDALHAAITQYGWDSDQTDAAREQLFRDRAEYRKLRRSLRAAGVAVPPPTGMGMRAGGPDGDRPNRRADRMSRAGRGYHRGGMCNCPCGY